MRLVILEGARGTGKSTVARAIREKVSEVTLTNPTGFHLDGPAGKEKISEYYWNWFVFLKTMKFHDSTFVFDRFFFSETVFSTLYKDYDFSTNHKSLSDELTRIAEEVDIIFFIANDEEELRQRLLRDKVPFGKAEESVAETRRQQELYNKLFLEFAENHMSNKVRIHIVDTTRKTQEQVEEEVLKIVGGK
jgi:deoxyguanosine kinase